MLFVSESLSISNPSMSPPVSSQMLVSRQLLLIGLETTISTMERYRTDLNVLGKNGKEKSLLQARI